MITVQRLTAAGITDMGGWCDCEWNWLRKLYSYLNLEWLWMCQQGARISHLQFPSVQGDRPGMTVVKWSYATSYCEQKLHVSSRTAENVYSCIVGLPDRQHEPQQQDEKMRGEKKKCSLVWQETADGK